MKVLLNCSLPFALAHGGWEIQIEQTQAALLAIGIEAEPVQWWNNRQTGDLIHYFGRMPETQVALAQKKHIKVVMAELLTAPGSRSPGQLRRQKIIRQAMERFAPQQFLAAFNWKSYQLADACVANTHWEAHLMRYLFAAPPERVHVIPNGVESVFFNSPTSPRGEWLVCTATITERKRVLELAQAAVAAQTPVWIIGQAYANNDAYAAKFFALAKQNSGLIRYEGSIGDRSKLAQIYRAARGFVLLSAMETRSLSAEEAAACECPLLLSDLPWARSVFNEQASYCPIGLTAETAARLRQFYDAAPTLPAPLKPATWQEVAHQLKALYERVLSVSR